MHAKPVKLPSITTLTDPAMEKKLSVVLSAGAPSVDEIQMANGYIETVASVRKGKIYEDISDMVTNRNIAKTKDEATAKRVHLEHAKALATQGTKRGARGVTGMDNDTDTGSPHVSLTSGTLHATTTTKDKDKDKDKGEGEGKGKEVRIPQCARRRLLAARDVASHHYEETKRAHDEAAAAAAAEKEKEQGRQSGRWSLFGGGSRKKKGEGEGAGPGAGRRVGAGARARARARV